jgi:hypothetical protein
VSVSDTGLPDGFFSDQKSQFGYIMKDQYIFGGYILENAVKYSSHLEFFTTIGYILWDIFFSHFGFFPGLGMLFQEKSGNPEVTPGKKLINIQHTICVITVVEKSGCKSFFFALQWFKISQWSTNRYYV